MRKETARASSRRSYGIPLALALAAVLPLPVICLICCAGRCQLSYYDAPAIGILYFQNAYSPYF